MTLCIEAAAEYGQIKVLEYLKDKKPDNFRRCTECCEYCWASILGGQVETLSWLFENGFRLRHEDRATNRVVHTQRCKRNMVVGFTLEQCLIQSEDIDCIKFAYDHTTILQWSAIHTVHFSASGNLECLKYIHEIGCPFDLITTLCAAENGQLDVLRWLYENGCPWNVYTTMIAGLHDETRCLEYAIANGCAV
jgi:hypothetical protein